MWILNRCMLRTCKHNNIIKPNIPFNRIQHGRMIQTPTPIIRIHWEKKKTEKIKLIKNQLNRLNFFKKYLIQFGIGFVRTKPIHPNQTEPVWFKNWI